MDLMSIAVNPELEIGGAWVEPWEDGTELLVARYNNTEFRKVQARLMEPAIKLAGRGGVSTEEAENILSRTLAKTVLLGWKKLFIDSKEVKYTAKRCMEIMTDPRFIDFKETVMRESQTMEHYRLQALEADAKN